ncbi:unnamed protein product [Sphagnum jensenii]|uniref:Uncharacterized protein n=1 Tax=Sphagnum jensenii TaxID=128206 RepID=A0ABP0WPT4_9BRYO
MYHDQNTGSSEEAITHSLICFPRELRGSKFLFSAILPGLGNYCVPAAGLDFRRIHGKFGARNRCNFRTFSAEFSFWICVFRGWTPGSFAAEGIAMALHSVMMQARALHHDHFQQLSASQSSFVSPISSSRNQFRSFTPKSFGCCRPVTGSFSQCALSLKGGGRAPPRSLVLFGQLEV